MASKAITLLTSDRLSSRMFVEYYTAIHAGGKRPLTISPSLYNEASLVALQIEDAKSALKGEGDLVVLYSVPDSFDSARTPEPVIGASDIVLRFNPKRTGAAVALLHDKTSEGESIATRFSKNLERLASGR